MECAYEIELLNDFSHFQNPIKLNVNKMPMAGQCDADFERGEERAAKSLSELRMIAGRREIPSRTYSKLNTCT